MAKAINQSIPPSLRAGVAKVLSIPGGSAGAGAVIGLRPSARFKQPPPVPPRSLAILRNTSLWFEGHWPDDRHGEDPRLFQQNRRKDLYALTFPEKYWYALEPIEDATDYGEPTIGPYAGDLNRPWFDETRLPSVCTFGQALRSYPTPGGLGTPQYPGPGWQGAVISGVWRDLWFAQRRLTYALPKTAYRPLGRQVERPLLAVVEGSVTALASYRGYASWFALGVWPTLYHDVNSPPPVPAQLITHWHQDDLARFIMPSDRVSDWSGTAHWRTLRNIALKPGFEGRTACNRLVLRVTTPPSRGIYFARNDSVHVAQNVTLRVYQAKAWNG
jgi:hypothetical protein